MARAPRPHSASRADWQRPWWHSFFAFHELEEAAGLPVRGLVLVQEGQMGFLELVKEFVPVDRFQVLVVGERDAQHAGFLAVDRKSTRLNSSHPSISYAVFCLKKKKEHPDD